MSVLNEYSNLMETKMDIFKDTTAHTNLTNDMRHVHTCARECVTRLSEKTLDTLVEQLNEEIFNNLTEEGATALSNLSNAHPDSDIEWLLDFMVWRNGCKVESAKDFNTRMAEEVVDENLTAQVRVYSDDFFIEVLDDGRHMLVVENQSWIEPETPLDSMELELYNFTQVVGG